MSIMSERTATSKRSFAGSVNIIGTVRPGTKLLSKKAAENQGAKAIADKAFAGQIKFDEAEKQIAKLYPDIKKAFYPQNTQHFNLHPCDFTGGAEVVNRLLELHGEQRPGDKVKKLYRFPIVFPDVGSADAAVPVGFEMHVGMRYRSQDALDGTRKCVFLKPVTAADAEQNKAKRIKQIGRREFTIRGDCEPTKCAEFARGDCTLRGNLQFYIPGLQGLGVVKMPTGSSYALEKIWLQWDSLHKTVGRIPNFNQNSEPVFYLTKMQEKRKYFDAEGGENTGLQWVPVLHANIDQSAIMLIQEQRRDLLLSNQPSGNVVQPSMTGPSAPSAWVANPPMGVAVHDVAKADVQASLVQAQNESEKEFHAPSKNTANVEDAVVKTKVEPKQSAAASSLDAWLISIGVDAQRAVLAYADAKFGAGWDRKDEALNIELQTFVSKYPPDCVVSNLAILKLVLVNGVDGETFKAYAKAKYAGVTFMRDSQKSQQVLNELTSLFSQGVEVSTTLIKQAIEASKQPS